MKNQFTKTIFLYSAILLFVLSTCPHQLCAYTLTADPQDVLSFGNSIEMLQFQQTSKNATKTKKDWTVIIYMAAVNDLRSFAIRNIKQMAMIGSNYNINIVVHIDIQITNKQKVTRRYYIEKNKITHINENDPTSQQMDSGDPKTLISCCKWAINDYPAYNYALILWNHGTGCNDPVSGRIVNPVELFSFNTKVNLLELNRTHGFFELLDGPDKRGICWDDSTGNYLTNQKLSSALYTITQQELQGKKFDIIGFDACLMSMIEVGSQIKDYADIMVGSQEVELGMGWDYTKVLAPFTYQSFTPYEFAQHIVNTYEKVYSAITADYTQSAINLTMLDELEDNVHNIAVLLRKCLTTQKNNTVKKALWVSHSKSFCTHFDEPSYIDMSHFYSNLKKNIRYFELQNKDDERIIKLALDTFIDEGQKIILKAVIANVSGKNLSNAQGLSIYFPEQKLHSSYPRSNFGSNNAWCQMLNQYLITG